MPRRFYSYLELRKSHPKYRHGDLISREQFFTNYEAVRKARLYRKHPDLIAGEVEAIIVESKDKMEVTH